MALKRTYFGIALAASLLTIVPAWPAENRISGPVDGRQTVRLASALHPKATRENDRGPVAPTLTISGISLNVKLSVSQQAELERLLEEQRDPSSPNYQKWLSPEEFGDRFGLSIADMDQLTSWLRSQGFTVDHVSRSMNWVSFSGSAAQVDQTFHTSLHSFLVDGRLHFANTEPPSIPAALKDLVADFRGLTDFRLEPQRLRVVSPDYTSGSSHYLAPGDLATIFDINSLYSAGIDGTGQSLVVAGQTDVALSDITAFRNQFGLSANLPQLVLFGADPGTSSGDLVEADLDLEWTGAVARNAKIIYVYSGDVITSVQYAISQKLAPVISLSYGGCEAENSPSLESIAQQANAQGITWLASTGDSGAAGCDDGKVATMGLAVNMPASIPEVTAVGGSEFSEGSGSYWSSSNGANGGSALSYIPEMAWNDSASRNELAATGGGSSIYYPKPIWQTGAGVPADGARDIPDVTLPASPDHDGYEFYTGGKAGVVGGTSASTPAFAGVVTLLNQYLVSKGVQAKPGLGNINPTLYHLAASVTSPFHDITTGNNIVPCKAGTPDCVNGMLGYTAGAGYDRTTGLGSVDVNQLITQWSSLPASIGTTLSLSASPTSIASTATTTLTATVKPATGTTAPTGTVTFSLVTTTGFKTLGTASLAASGSNGVATLTVNGTSLTTGSINASYGGSVSFNGSTGSTAITITGTVTTVNTSSALTANPASILTTGTTVLTATVKSVGGSALPTGNVTFSAGTTTLGTAALTQTTSGSVASLSVAASQLGTGSVAVTSTYAGATGFNGSSAHLTVTVTAPTSTISTTTSVTANPASITAAQSTTLTATVKPASGATAPTGAIIFTLGTKVLGNANLVASGANSVASLVVTGTQLTAANPNTIKATYYGSTVFTSSSASVAVTLTTNSNSPKSAVTATITPNPVVQQHGSWVFTIQLANTGGPTTLTNFAVNGTSYSPEIPMFFGSAKIPANGSLKSNLQMTNVPVPTSNVFTFGGTDASGGTWTQTVTVAFQ